jgi:hypothetical protein
MMSTFNILLTTKTARLAAGVTTIAGPLAMAGAWVAAAARMDSAGFDQDHNFNALAHRGAG